MDSSPPPQPQDDAPRSGLPEELPPEVVSELLRILDANPEARQRQIQQLAETCGRADSQSPVSISPQLLEGTEIGPYTLREKLGEGGMGVVFRAEQSRPIVRDVAIKLVKPGIRSLEAVARFEAERQALASMSHPGIASVIEAGVTSAELGSQPYFAMELVRGDPITLFCDAECMGLDQRLELFAAVCDAVQHAHFRGVLHRDLKPSNVLVTAIDGKPQPKVIDFGLARWLDNTDQDKTRLTRHGEVLGTPTYMSPEQLEPGQPRVDTRTDVYALGCILYELLVGSPPLEFSGSSPLRFGEIESAILQTIPRAPSTRVFESDDPSRLAAARDLAPGGLRRALVRELDWICRKAIAKEPERRYASVADLAADVRRWHAGEAVLAGPDSTWYLSRKLIARHRVAFTGAGLVLVSLVTGLITTARESVRANGAETRAVLAARQEKLRADEAVRARDVTESVTRFLVDVLSASNPAGGKIDVMVSEALTDAVELANKRFADDPEVLSEILLAVGATLRSIGKIEDSLQPLERHVELVDAELALGRERDRSWATPTMAIAARNELAIAVRRVGKTPRAIEIYSEALELARSAKLEERAAVLTMNLSVALESVGRLDDAITYAEESLALHKLVFADDLQRIAIVMSRHAAMQQRGGHVKQGLASQEKAVAMFRQAFGAKPHPYLAAALSKLSSAAQHANDQAKSLAAAREALAVAQQVYGDEHVGLLTYIGNLSVSLLKTDQLESALVQAQHGAALARKLLKPSDPRYLGTVRREAVALLRANRPAEALPIFEECVLGLEKVYSKNHRSTVATRSLWGECLAAVDRDVEAERQLLQAYEDARPSSVSLVERLQVTGRVLKYYQMHERVNEAERWQARLDKMQQSKN